jgi:hypothetical protein
VREVGGVGETQEAKIGRLEKENRSLRNRLRKQ